MCFKAKIYFFSRFCFLPSCEWLKMCVLWTNLWEPFRGPHYDGLVSKNYPFKRTFWVGTQKCPYNLNRPHFAGVFSYECPCKCAAVSTYTHTLSCYTHREICNHVLERKNSSKGLNFNKKWGKPQKVLIVASFEGILRNTPLVENRGYFINWLISNSMNYSKWNFQFNVKAFSDLRKVF